MDVESVRKNFPVLNTQVNGFPLTYLDSAASSQKPLAVIDAISTYYKTSHANVHRGVHHLSQEATAQYEGVREKTKHFINARENHEIIFTRGTTESVNLVAQGFGQRFLSEGDEIVISGMEHHSNIVPWQMACERSGAVLKVIPLLPDGTLDMAAAASRISNKTKLLAVVHVSNSLGTINPVKELIALAKNKNAAVLLDGAQAVPHLSVDVQDLDCDFYCFSSHKMYGPTGIGILYGKELWLEKLPPYQGGGEMIETVTFEKTTYAALPYKFEAGTPNIAGTIGFGACLDYINELGYGQIAAWEEDLLHYATKSISQFDGLKILGPKINKVSVISFTIDGLHPFDIGTILDQHGIAVRTGHHCTQPIMDYYGIPGTVRASISVYNNKQDIDRLVVALERSIKMLRK